ncbi:MAG: hypothetical protein IAE81_15235 [Caldilineaceae bacterium]|jgi:hypothetical protein|nr:hypothetical protein [Caldilineaceae bacterium]
MLHLINNDAFHFRYSFITACLVAIILFLIGADTANAQIGLNDPIRMRVPSGCNNPNYTFGFSSINTATKDTIPLEWWPPSALGVPSGIPFTTLKAASIQVRSRLYWNRQNPLEPTSNPVVHFYSHNINTRAGQNPASSPFQEIDIWMREDGFVFDKILLTSSVNYVPQ